MKLHLQALIIPLLFGNTVITSRERHTNPGNYVTALARCPGNLNWINLDKVCIATEKTRRHCNKDHY